MATCEPLPADLKDVFPTTLQHIVFLSEMQKRLSVF